MTFDYLPHLAPIYGSATGAALSRRVAALVEAWRPRLPRAGKPRRRLDLTERDAILITYGDQLREANRAPLPTLGAFCTEHLRGLLNGIHLLPFYPSSSDDGFSVKDYYAVDPALGAWDDLRSLARSFELMYDAVFNHASAQGEWFQRFRADDPHYRGFFTVVTGEPDLTQVVRPRALPLLTEFTTPRGPEKVWTTFSADQVDLNYRDPEVLLRMLDVLLFYVSQGARFIRLDAIAFLWKEFGTPCLHLPQTHGLIRLWRAVLDDVAPQVLLITETNVPHAENLTYFGDGHSEAQLVYNFALPPLVLHSFATGNAAVLTRWAQALTLPSDAVTFLNFLASHDGIGVNPARGLLSESEIEHLVRRVQQHGGFISHKHMPDGSRRPYELNINYLDGLSDPSSDDPVELAARKSLTAHAILLSLRGLPAIYFHSLFGSRGDRGAAETSGIPRRINREKLERSRLEAELRDPGSLRARVFGGFRNLLNLRSRHPAFAPGAPQRVLELEASVFAVLRESEEAGDRVLCLHNVSPNLVTTRLDALPGPTHPWSCRWTPPSGVRHAGGSSAAEAASPITSLILEPYGAAWLVPAGADVR